MVVTAIACKAKCDCDIVSRGPKRSCSAHQIMYLRMRVFCTCYDGTQHLVVTCYTSAKHQAKVKEEERHHDHGQEGNEEIRG